MGIEIGDCDWGLRFGILDWDWGFVLGTWDWDGGLGLEIRIEDWELRLVIGD